MLNYETKIFNDFASSETAMQKLPRPIVFTNGCFDILHLGHVDYLAHAALLGSSLIVGVNTDRSVRCLNKDTNRPFNPLLDRLSVLASLSVVDMVIGFDEETPLQLISQLIPEILVKGDDWAVNEIVGADVVKQHGGSVQTIPFRYQRSTTALARLIKGQ